jgi:hypothetical protein
MVSYNIGINFTTEKYNYHDYSTKAFMDILKDMSFWVLCVTKKTYISN